MIELRINRKTNNTKLRNEILEAFPGLGGNPQAVRIYRPVDAKENEQVIQINAGISEKALVEVIERHRADADKADAKKTAAAGIREVAKRESEPELDELMDMAKNVEGAREAIAIAMAAQSLFNERRQSQKDEIIHMMSDVETRLQKSMESLGVRQGEQERMSGELRNGVDRLRNDVDSGAKSLEEIGRSVEEIRSSLRLVLLFKDQIKEAVSRS